MADIRGAIFIKLGLAPATKISLIFITPPKSSQVHHRGTEATEEGVILCLSGDADKHKSLSLFEAMNKSASRKGYLPSFGAEVFNGLKVGISRDKCKSILLSGCSKKISTIH